MKLVLLGDVPSQKNSKRIVYSKAKQRNFIISSDRARKWQQDAYWQLWDQIKLQHLRLDARYPVAVGLTVYFSSLRRHDLDNVAGGVLDALVKAEVLVDDSVKYVSRVELLYGGVDKLHPRVEINIVSTT